MERAWEIYRQSRREYGDKRRVTRRYKKREELNGHVQREGERKNLRSKV